MPGSTYVKKSPLYRAATCRLLSGSSWEELERVGRKLVAKRFTEAQREMKPEEYLYALVQYERMVCLEPIKDQDRLDTLRRLQRSGDAFSIYLTALSLEEVRAVSD